MDKIRYVTIRLKILPEYYKGRENKPLFKKPQVAFKGLIDKMLGITGLNKLMHTETVKLDLLDCSNNEHLIDESDSCVFCGVITEQKKGDFEWDIG